MNREQRRAVVIAAGGTGGHVVPALAVAAQLRQRNIPVVWLGTRSGMEATMAPAQGIEVRWIEVAGWRSENVLNRVLGPFRLGRAVWQSIRHIRALKPRAVMGMGGFVSGPVGLAALLLRRPLVLHEQNAVAGMTNRWLSHFANRVFSAWPDVFKVSRDAQVVGNPVRAEMEALANKPSSIQTDPDQALRVLVVGGSRGARALNELLPQALTLIEAPVVIHHQSGAAELAMVRQAYSGLHQHQIQVSAFIDDMTHAYLNTDLVVCRSGAMTVSELAALGLPSLLVPFPFAVDDHQTCNARYLSDCGAAILMPQSTLKADLLAQTIKALQKDRQKLVLMSNAARGRFIPEAATTVANAVLEVSR